MWYFKIASIIRKLFLTLNLNLPYASNPWALAPFSTGQANPFTYTGLSHFKRHLLRLP